MSIWRRTIRDRARFYLHLVARSHHFINADPTCDRSTRQRPDLDGQPWRGRLCDAAVVDVAAGDVSRPPRQLAYGSISHSYAAQAI